jgi:hypothetical protein
MIAVPSVREVLKEGKIVKISARTGDHQDRYLFLVRGFWILKFSNTLIRRGKGTATYSYMLRAYKYMDHTCKILIIFGLSIIYLY